VFLLTPALASGAGLGRLALQSALGQPLKAEIEVVALRRGETESLSARIASPDAFRQAGVDYGAAISSMRASVQRRDGGYVVLLSSAEPINEPFIDVLVELNWGTGRLVRQYTFLLDPVEYKGPRETPPAMAATEVKPIAPPKSPEPVVVPDAPKPAAAPAAEPGAPVAAAPAPAAGGAAPSPAASPGSYEVQKGDTLSQIAMANLPAGVTLHQMLVALYRANEDAFINKNMNLVRSGAMLKIPTQEEATAVAREDATKVVSVQAQEFDEYRGRVAGAVAAAPAREEPGQRAAGRIAAGEPTPAAPKMPPQDQLRLSRADEAAGKAAKSEARADDLAAKERALTESSERIAQLERNVKDMEKLLELKNQQLAQLQKQAEAAKAPPLAPAAAAPEPPKTVEPPTPAKAAEPVKAPEPPQTVEPAKAPDAARAPETTEPAKAAEQSPSAALPPAQATAKPKPRPAMPPPLPASEPSIVDELIGNPVALGGIGGVLLLLVGYGAYAYRKKKATSLENSLAGVTTTDSSSVFGTTGGRSVDTGASSLQTDFSQSGIGAIDTDEVDPVAEADVYMAYGRDAQAEEILKEALQKDPGRQAVRVKLLEIYAARKDLKAFETTAGEIYAATGGQGADWEKAAVLGQQVDPANPLYGGKRTEPGPVARAATVFSQPTSVVSPAVAAALATPEVSSPRAAPPSIDFNLEASGEDRGNESDIALDLSMPSQAPTDVAFDLDLGEPSQPSEKESDFSPSGTLIMDHSVQKAARDLSEGSVDLAIDFELPGGKTSPELENTAKMTAQSQPTVVMPQSQGPKAPAPSGGGLDLDFRLDEPTREPRAPAPNLSGISLDLGAPGEAAPPPTAGWQEVATKLDLAKAYEEMGDKDGARELLNEVIKEGDNAQQQRARSMLDALR
jgi:pilus assembly protein FimV